MSREDEPKAMDEATAMRRALALAARARGLAEPNPLVGAVLLHGGRVVGEGFHERFGTHHAEVNCLRDAATRGLAVGDRAVMAQTTMCVTLEPCAHHGKTPPCADALVEAGVGRVVVAMIDPDERVQGRGVQRLREAGVAVEVGLCEAEARRLNEPFIKRVTTGLPWVIAKWAQTLDGKTATATGHSQWISNAASRAVVHELRGRVDAVMVGVGTVIADDPLLTARPADPRKILRQARRVVVDRSGRMPPAARMLHDGGPPVTVVGGDLREGLRQLAADGASSVLVEGGATLLGALLGRGLVDQLLVFVAPRIVGDAAALGVVAGLDCPTIDKALEVELVDVRRLGGDVLLDYRVAHG